MRNLFFTIIMMIIALLLSGCYNASGDIELRSDGSGNLAFVLDIEKDYYNPGSIKKSLEDSIDHYSLTNELKITKYTEKEIKDKNMAQINCLISFKDVDKLKYLELGVSMQKIPYASMSASEQAKYPNGSYKLKIEAEEQGTDSISLSVRPTDKVLDSNGTVNSNVVRYKFVGKATRDNYIILKPVKLNLFNLIFI